MTTDSLLVFSLSTAVSTAVAIFDHWLAHNQKLAANCTLQFVYRFLHGAAQAVRVTPTGIAEHLVEGVAKIGEQAVEQSVDVSWKGGAHDSAREPHDPGTPNFGAGGV